MNKLVFAVDIHSELTTLDAFQEELRINPSRLEEWEVGINKLHPQVENTPLMSAAVFGNSALCEFLLSVGANIDAKNEVNKEIFTHFLL